MQSWSGKDNGKCQARTARDKRPCKELEEVREGEPRRILEEEDPGRVRMGKVLGRNSLDSAGLAAVRYCKGGNCAVSRGQVHRVG